MKTLWKIFAGLLAVVAILVLGLSHLAGGGLSVWELFLDSTPIPKMIELLLVPVLLLAVVLPNGKGQTGGFLKFLLWFGLGFGALGTVYGLLNIWIAVQRTHTHNLQIVAPSLAESLLPIGLGLLIAVLAAWKVASARKPSPAASFD